MAKASSTAQIGRNGTGPHQANLSDLTWLTGTEEIARELTGALNLSEIIVGEPLREFQQAHPTPPQRPRWLAEDLEKLAGIADARERVIVFNERTLDKSSAFSATPSASGDSLGAAPFVPARVHTVNGQLRPEISIQPGEIQRWRVLNAESHHAIWLHVEGHLLHQIAQDGIPFGRTRSMQSIMLVPGNHVDILLRANREGRYRIYTAAYDQGQLDGPRPAAELATLAVSGRPVFSRLPRHLVGPPAIPIGPVWHERTLHVGPDGSGDVGFTINGEEIDFSRVGDTATDTVEEWTLINDDPMQHPIYVKGNPFQVVEVQGIPASDLSWQTDPEIWWYRYRLPAYGRVKIRVYFSAAAITAS